MHYFIIYFFFILYQQHTNVILLKYHYMRRLMRTFSVRDTIESTAHHYNSQCPGDIVVSMPYQNEHTVVNNIMCYNYIKSLYISD